LARAIERGEMRADADVQALIDLLYGAIYYRLLLHTRPLEPEQIDAALDITFEGLLGGHEAADAHDA
jgi:Tetracyclin repressor-like, C-terminal domain